MIRRKVRRQVALAVTFVHDDNADTIVGRERKREEEREKEKQAALSPSLFMSQAMSCEHKN